MRSGFVSVVMIALLVVTSGSVSAQTPVPLPATQPGNSAINAALGPSWTLIGEGPDLASSKAIVQVTAVWGGAGGARLTVTTVVGDHPTRKDNENAWLYMENIFAATFPAKQSEISDITLDQCDEFRAAQNPTVTEYGATTSLNRTMVLCSTSSDNAILIDLESDSPSRFSFPPEIDVVISAFISGS